MPEDRLDLTIERSVIERARRYSELHGISISQLVNDFLSSLPLEGEDVEEDLSPTVRRLLGVAAGGADREDYRRYLLEKYGS